LCDYIDDMRPTEIIFLVRKYDEVELLKGLDPASGGMRRLILQVAGEANSLTVEGLRRLRRSADAAKRRTPVVVWTATAADAEKWRVAGALALVGGPSVKTAAKALEVAREVPWIESSGYVGPDRRHKKAWLNRTVRRLADSEVGAQPDRAAADNSSFDTRMRQLRFAAFGIDKADRARRAQFLADVRAAVGVASRNRRLHSSAAMESLARYLAGQGAKGSIEQSLVDKHLLAADAAPGDAASMIPRLERSVDRALGLVAPA
jgi:hypothetical protein